MTNEKMNWRKRFWNSEKLIGISAMIISIGTLFVLVYQTRLIREQQYKSVYPHLMITRYVDMGNKEYRLKVTNNGIGPAIINKVDVFGKDTSYNVDLGSFLVNEFMEDSVACTMSSLHSGMLLPEKDYIEAYTFYGVNSREKYNKVYNFMESTEIVIEYESVYGEKWHVSNRRNTPIKID